MADIKSAASSLDIDRISFSIGQRESSLSEVNDLIRRVNFAREAGCDVPDSVRAGLITHRTHLMEDKATAEAKQRIEEATAKAVAQENARSAPMTTDEFE